jgi:hypothetical protein
VEEPFLIAATGVLGYSARPSERWMSGLSRTPGKRVWDNIPTGVRIPPSPPNTKPSLVDGFFWLRWWGTSRTPLDSTSKHRLRRMPKAVPNEMRDEVFADATRKPNNPPLNKSKGHPHGCPFHFIALRFKTIAKLNPLALLLATSEPP